MTRDSHLILDVAANRELRPWEDMLIEAIKATDDVAHATKTDPTGAAVFVRIGDKHHLTAYADLDREELAEAAMHILFDAIAQHVEASFERLMDSYESGEYEAPGDGEEDDYGTEADL